MKGRVETLKRRNHMNLVREVACTPRKNRSMSECSSVSTASMSSKDTPWSLASRWILPRQCFEHINLLLV
ncbi:hypothetical protein P3T76_005203 [Phytophthora citrophthora]|uniref:Uncharacterized protein n=1 Tax=Phytophthora citrophthora TaxID=4793 RepID=A0AAD9LQL4_9STRA|nr:hypothetical protein P3T76_005203 [Phytophthora citrophthora]